MEDEKNNGTKSFATRMETFFAGKGFYIVLLLCVAVIGVSAWAMLSGGGNSAEDAGAVLLPVSEVEDETVSVGKTDFPVVTEAPAATSAPAVTEAPAATRAPAETPAPAVVEQPQAQQPAAEVRDYYIWPVSGEIADGYAMSSLRYDRTMLDWRTHDGVDIAAELGTQVRAAAGGTVTAVYDGDSLGTTVEITHNGGLKSVYANLAATPAVSVGDRVTVGQVIGAVGSTALYESGEVSHLHFAMSLDGVSVDPNEYLP